jgi:trans-2,3-dihydro-3-hydroxyanthranilate isomerase
MTRYRFHLVNVFAETPLGGNPLCVFEDARGLSDEQMLALARQFNLSETTFILPSETAHARVRVFTPGYEMRFAGHPTLGTAHVVRELLQTGDQLTLEFLAGVVPVEAVGEVWRFNPPASTHPPTRPIELERVTLAALLGLQVEDLLGEPMWVDAGADQMLIPLVSPEAVRRAAPNAGLMAQWPLSSLGRKTGYVFAFETPQDNLSSAPRAVLARYFFTTQGGGVSEDPGTGSACANLGGWLLATGHALPVRCAVAQGEAIERPCHLQLEVGVDRRISVGGRVLELGQGYIDLSRGL